MGGAIDWLVQVKSETREIFDSRLPGTKAEYQVTGGWEQVRDSGEQAIREWDYTEED